ncbi:MULTISPECIES: hypothetical protein [Flavobacterium]|uniref:Uncharacterized protein n=2 Tax=Flavobacterium TaxID=237 RepID=A0AA94F3A0_9FLAO|nr:MULTISPECIES: hypothetical protein [Flavobacterium]OXA81542.1 hypothetical protein B0A56_05925 [Flavobacterium columnare NBRC 100251 = ATCC 23463]AMA48499.1 hypothetical protein AWN65_03015 [Flavobacterium covae]AND65374.1 hypothetical protein AX766_13750 [Flavobacterium covae]MCH4830446.1 hypothetical protein [Flavobacterium columnare]MCH4833618.1 hypothetical protein [Flavobacterium columnare]
MKKVGLSLLFITNVMMGQTVKFEKEKIKEMETVLFEETFVTVNNKKTSTVILKDGRTIIGYFKDINRKKGQIEEVEVKDSVTGKVEDFEASKISELYLSPSGSEKFRKTMKHFTNIRSMSTKNHKKATNKETVFYKNQLVSLKNKKEEKEYLMQLINPSFNSIIEVYGDPNANETGGVAIGGMKMGGGVIKSYYVKKGDKMIWLHKDEFKETYNNLFGDNAEFMKNYPLDSVKWDYFSFLIYEYTRMTLESK